MAIELIEGFELATQALGSTAVHDWLAVRWGVSSNTSDLKIVPGALFGNALQLELNGASSPVKYIEKTFTDQQTRIVQIRAQIGEPYAPLNPALFELKDGSSSQFRVVPVWTGDSGSPDYYLSIRRGGNTEIGTSGVLTGGTFRHFQIKVDLATDATGSYEIRMNGTNIASATGVQTATDSTTADTVRFEGMCNGSGIGVWVVDDILIMNGVDGTTVGQSAAWNDFVAAKVVPGTVLSADGTTNEATPSTGSSHYAMVDELGLHDSDSTYLLFDDDDLTELFDSTALPFIEDDVDLMNFRVVARTVSAGSRDMSFAFRSGGSNGSGAAFTVNDSGYAMYEEILFSDPTDDGALTKTIIDAAEKGLQSEPAP